MIRTEEENVTFFLISNSEVWQIHGICRKEKSKRLTTRLQSLGFEWRKTAAAVKLAERNT